MDKFIIFTRDRMGTTWYMCTSCGEKLRYKPNICPVCGSGKPVSPEVENAVELLLKLK